MSEPSLEFINHASVLIKNKGVSLLSDPWYQGDAFHKGWKLVHELSDTEIGSLLDRTSHIWVSHEHPDHFSIMFFKKFSDQIKKRNIQILFQNTTDKRVEGFLRSCNFNIKILETDKWVEIGDDFRILNFKDGFYDSGLAINTGGKKFLNLNDCEIKTPSRCKEILNKVGECDVLISQFSYAAWKGGKENIEWRKLAAREKLETLSLQVEYFKPSMLIPFASYVYFSNEVNHYLNDSSNKPESVVNHFKENINVNVRVMKPFEIINNYEVDIDSTSAVSFWKSSFKKSLEAGPQQFIKKDIEELKASFLIYKERLFKNNSQFLIKTIKNFSPIPAFKPITIHIIDLNQNISIDLFSKQLMVVNDEPDISMMSESLDFIFKNTFGYDTLTVNGCFEEKKSGGFAKMTKLLAIENLNNIGIYIKLSIVFRFDIIIMFIKRLSAVNKKIKNA
jgi:hypothetical protein